MRVKEVIAAQSGKPSWTSDAGEDQYGRWADFVIEGVTSRLRWIPPGRFVMGSPKDEEGRYADEGPQHEVTFEYGYWLMETAVTQAFFEAITDEDPLGFRDIERPVESISWKKAVAFCNWANAQAPNLSLRLPSEAEWEYACRAGTATAYSFGSAFNLKLANARESGRGKSMHVKSFPPNAWGLYEMHGNVREWCEDDWHDSYEGAPSDGSAWIDAPERNAGRVVRGGSWDYAARFARSAYRLDFGREYHHVDLGFRCARSAD